MHKNIAVLAGDGIGPEIITEVIKVLQAIEKKYKHSFSFDHALMGAIAIDATGNDDIAIGRKIVKQAITEPFIKILTNAGHDVNDIRYASFKLLDSGDNLWAGLNYKDLSTIDYKKEGIIDPKKVTRIALENASSIAGTILTTESVVYEKRKEKEEEAPNPMAGMM